MSYSTYMKQANLINGQWVSADSEETFSVINPATGEVIGNVPASGHGETERAISAAAKAFPEYAAKPLLERVELLWKLHDALLDNQKDLAELLTIEQGKPLVEANGEIVIGAAYIRWFAEEIRRNKGEIVPAAALDRRILVTNHPVGVVGMITPWNFPSSMLARKLGPALAAGCTVVAKPASATPYSGLAWGVLCEEVGFPRGVVNILTGPAKEIGNTIMKNSLVRKVTFTGSTEVGKELIKSSAVTVKKVSMELGGNAPFLVFNDADLDKAVGGAIVSKFRNAGQTCVCANRIYVQSGVYQDLVKKFLIETAKIKVGDGRDFDVEQGPLIDMNEVLKVEELLEDAVKKGAKIVLGGSRHDKGATFFSPTVITGVTQNMRFSKEEIFGPLAPIFKFETEEEAIIMANDTDFGLCSYAYTRDVGRIMRLNEKLEYGMIGINSGLITTVEAPFGGVKESGLGKEGGSQGLEDYLDTKYTALDF